MDVYDIIWWMARMLFKSMMDISARCIKIPCFIIWQIGIANEYISLDHFLDLHWPFDLKYK
jgi:hypothetical protein